MRFTALALALLTSGVAGAQSQTLYFFDANGLSAEAEFTLMGGGSQLEIRFRNRSEAIPMGFSNSDQILSGISFDLGAPGQVAGDPEIVSGTVMTGPSSSSINFDTDIGPNADVSGEYGFANSPTTNTYPNFVSAHGAGSTPFGGSNLDGPASLAGPAGGIVSSAHIDLGGQGAIEDEIIATVDLSVMIADLTFLENGARIEYGSDAAFLDECETFATNVVVEDPLGLNASGALFPAGALPVIGTNYPVKMDDAADQCGITPGSLSWVIVNESPMISAVIPGFGCAPGQAGNLMIDVFDPQTHFSGPVAWNGPGEPACHSFVIADNPALCGQICRGQGFWIDPMGDSGPVILTNVVEFVLGP